MPAATMNAAPAESSLFISGGDGRAPAHDAQPFEAGADSSTQVDDRSASDRGTLFMSDGNGGDETYLLKAAPDRSVFDPRAGQEDRP